MAKARWEFKQSEISFIQTNIDGSHVIHLRNKKSIHVPAACNILFRGDKVFVQ